MLESPIVRRIKEAVYAKYGTRLHKYHGGAYGEAGCADLFGTLPGGYAVYFEVKTPDTIKKRNARRRLQEAWLKIEQKQGACGGVVASSEEALQLIETYLSTR